MRPIIITLVAAVLPAIVGCTAKAQLDLSSYESPDEEPGARRAGEAGSDPANVVASEAYDPAAAVAGSENHLTQTQGWSADKTSLHAGGKHQVHVVREGETLYSIARGYSVPLASLFAVNGLVSDSLVPGQHVIIPAHP